MPTLVSRLQSLHPAIRDILATSGSPGISLGVLHQGQVIHTAHFGRRDANRPDPPNDNTIYHVASLTKAITASAVASLVDDGVLDWDLPVRHYLPEFGQREDELGQKCTLIDLLSNRTGLAMANALWGQKEGEFLLPKSEIVPTICKLDVIKPFRDAFVYSQWNYALVTEIIEKITGRTLGEYVKEKILNPLDMGRTSFMRQEGNNVAPPYAILDDGTPYRIALTNLSDETGLAGATAARTSIHDLLSMYQSFLSANKHQLQENTHSTRGSPLKQVNKILSPYIGVGSANIEDVAYCMGLYRTRLPGNLGVSSMNNLLLGPKRMPRIGASSPGLEIYHHSGNVPGFTATTFLIPSSESAIVVLTNSLPYMDPTDFVGQLVVSTLLEEQPPQNLIKLCKQARSASLASYGALSAQLAKCKTTQPPHFPLAAYEGDYVNVADNFVLSIVKRKGGLLLTVQNLPLTKYDLYPYDRDTFYWPASRDAELKQCMWPIMSAGWHKIEFRATDAVTVDQLIWKHDPFGKAEVFHKQNIPSTSLRGKL